MPTLNIYYFIESTGLMKSVSLLHFADDEMTMYREKVHCPRLYKLETPKRGLEPR